MTATAKSALQRSNSPTNSKGSTLNELSYSVLEQLLSGTTPFQIIAAGVFTDQTQAKLVFQEVTQYLADVAEAPADATKGFVMTAAMCTYKKLQEVGDYGGSLRALELYFKAAQTNTIKPWTPK